MYLFAQRKMIGMGTLRAASKMAVTFLPASIVIAQFPIPLQSPFQPVNVVLFLEWLAALSQLHIHHNLIIFKVKLNLLHDDG